MDALAGLALATALASTVTATRVDAPPTLDGRLDEAVWQRAAASDAFTQRTPTDGEPAGDRTIVRVLYDDEAIYVGVDCPQRDPVVASLTRRDRAVEADWVSVALDSRRDGKTSYEFTISAAGVLSDAMRFDDTALDTSWDEIWEGRAARTRHGWSAELRIPLRALRFDVVPTQSFGLQLRRYVSARRELDEWAYAPRDVAGEVSRYGRLDGLRGLRSPSRIELRPFVAAELLHHDAEAETRARGFDPSLTAGLDLRWHMSPKLTLDATFFPDFGQIEADQMVLNLSTFESYFPEKRPFFLADTDVFAMPLQLVYTRRIGRAAGTPALLPGETPMHAPDPSVIAGAVKIAGTLGDTTSIGALVAMTEPQTVDVVTPSGATPHRLADPLSVFQVLRLKHALGANAHAGLALTSVNRLEQLADRTRLPPSTPGNRALFLCPSGPRRLGERCFHDAHVASVDGRFRSASGDYVADAQALVSLVEHGPPRTLRDGTVISSGDTGGAIAVHAAKEGGRHWVGDVYYQGYSSKVDINDLGYQERQALHRGHAILEYRTLEPMGPTLETHTKLQYRRRLNLDGLDQLESLTLGNYTRFKSQWSGSLDLHAQASRYDDREIGDGAALERAASAGVNAWVSSDPRARLNGELWSNVDLVEGGASGCQGGGRLTLRVLPTWDADLLPSWVVAAGELRFVEPREGAYVFGRQRADGVGLTLRSTYTFTPELTLQGYAQLYAEAVHFRDFTSSPALGKGGVVRLARLTPTSLGAGSSPDHRTTTLNLSLLVRWEYHPGSTLFVAYTHAQAGALALEPGEAMGLDLRPAAPRPAEDALFVKASYWWGG